jgi:hypothetical protein
MYCTAWLFTEGAIEKADRARQVLYKAQGQPRRPLNTILSAR